MEEIKIGDKVRLKGDFTGANLYNVMTIKTIRGTKAICNFFDRKLGSCDNEFELSDLKKDVAPK